MNNKFYILNHNLKIELMKRYFALLTVFIFLLTSITSYGQRPEDIIFKTYAGGGGKCFGRSMISNQFDTIEEKIITRPAYSYLREIPPVYKNETERILVEPAHTRIEVTPAEFNIVKERVKVKDADIYTNPTAVITEDDLFADGASQHESGIASNNVCGIVLAHHATVQSPFHWRLGTPCILIGVSPAWELSHLRSAMLHADGLIHCTHLSCSFLNIFA